MISVIIPARNAANDLPYQLGALASQTYDGSWELIIADNGSTDGTAEVAERWANRFESLRIVDASARVGLNHARNVGAQAARGELLLYCDADDVADRGWIAAMASAAESWDLLGGHLEVADLNDATWGERASDTRNGLPTARFLKYAIGANCGLRSTVLDDLGGWDETYLLGGTEVALFWRAQLASYELGYVREAVIHYKYRSDAKAVARQYYERGIASAHLYRDFREHGFQRMSPLRIAKSWLWLAVHLPDLFSRNRRKIWIKYAAARLGRVRGSFRYRVVWL